MNSFEYDPLNPKVKLPDNEILLLKSNVDRALRWLVDKILEAKAQPISITLTSSGD